MACHDDHISHINKINSLLQKIMNQSACFHFNGLADDIGYHGTFSSPWSWILYVVKQESGTRKPKYVERIPNILGPQTYPTP